MNTGQMMLGGNSSASTVVLRRAVRLGIVIISACAIMLFAIAGSASAASGADTGESLFKANCTVCHGDDGHGTATGKALNAPDLSSAAAQKLTDAQIQSQIENGKNNMPPFKSTLSAGQIKLLVTYVHSFGKKKK